MICINIEIHLLNNNSLNISWLVHNESQTKYSSVESSSIISIITQQSICGVIVFFCFVMSHWTINQSIFSTIDWHHTMAWFPASLLKTHMRLLACGTTMHIWFVYEIRHYATMMKMRHGFATLNSNKFVIYGQKHKVWIFVFLVRTRGTFRDQNIADLVKCSVFQQSHIVDSNTFKERC